MSVGQQGDRRQTVGQYSKGLDVLCAYVTGEFTRDQTKKTEKEEAHASMQTSWLSTVDAVSWPFRLK